MEPRAGGGFFAYLAAGGGYDISVSRSDLFGPLPAMYNVPVNADVSGLNFILPPQDEAVTDGGFEGGNLDAWQVGGTVVPTLPIVVHTGDGAVQLGDEGEDSYLSQVVSPALGLSNPTLSFLVRLKEAGLASTLRVEMQGAASSTVANRGTLSLPVTYTVTVEDGEWSHVWYDLTGMTSAALTLTFIVSGSPTVLVDEVSLGSSLKAGYLIYLPLVYREW